MSCNAKIHLKPGREKSILNKHPWIFSGAINNINGDPRCGDTVLVLSSDGDPLGLAAFSPKSNIRARMWTWDASENVDDLFFENKIKKAFSFRANLIEEKETNAVRLIHGESDGLPGLVVDRYADILIIQSLTCGVEKWKDVIIEYLIKLTGINNVYERSDAAVREFEGLPFTKGLIRGDHDPENLLIHENGLKFQIDPINGQKTGFFIDQRDNRLKLRELAANRKIMDCFCYTGGFMVNALAGDAKQIVGVDSSQDAIAICQNNIQLNGFEDRKVDLYIDDVFERLRRFRDSREKFDLIILDPPKFAPTYKQVQKASRAYKDINLLAFKLLNPGGILFTFSCSGGVDETLFQKIIFSAALDAGVNACIIDKMHQSSDHAISLSFPEGNYLKGLICILN